MLQSFLVAALLAVDLTGVWRGEIAPSIPYTLTLEQNGEAVSGAGDAAGRQFEIKDGRIENDNLIFSLTTPAGGQLVSRRVSAVLRENQLLLTDSGTDIALRRFDPKPSAVRAQQLADVIRIWGAIHFFHPYVAYKPLDWDAALINAVQSLNEPAARDTFYDLVTAMLAPLGDPETHVLRPGEPAPLPLPCECRAIVRSGFFEGAPNPSAPYYADWEQVGRRGSYVMRLSGGLRIALRTAEPSGGTAPKINTLDNPYRGDLPPRPYRLLALARYWNAIQYFYGYPESLETWDAALTEFVPQFEQAETREAYIFTVARLAARTHDAHSAVYSPTGLALFELGNTVNATLRNIDGEIVVTASAVPELHPGDVIASVNRRPALETEKFLMTLFPWSTARWASRIAGAFLLAGRDPVFTAGVRRGGNAAEEEIELRRDARYVSVDRKPVMPTAFGKLPSGLGYMDLTRLKRAEVDAAFDALLDTPGLIFDLRGYPQGTFPMLAARLTGTPVRTAILRTRIWHGPDPANVTENTLLQYAFPNGKPVYRGSIAVLIDSSAMSQSEHTGLYLEAAAKVIFVGTPTAGADGEVTTLALPGGVQARFAGMNARHADGRPLQGVGIIPDVWVEPTRKGIQEGRDEVLERAVELLTRH